MTFNARRSIGLDYNRRTAIGPEEEGRESSLDSNALSIEGVEGGYSSRRSNICRALGKKTDGAE